MKYSIKAHPTKYNGVRFRSRLEARWAAYLDLIGWKWEYEPIDIEGWVPDFRVSFKCTHTDCCWKYGADKREDFIYHTLLAEVKPYYEISDFKGHPCLNFPFGSYYGPDGYITDIGIPADASAAFGINPFVTQWSMVHGSGGGVYSIPQWGCRDDEGLWKEAGNIVQWLPRA